MRPVRPDRLRDVVDVRRRAARLPAGSADRRGPHLLREDEPQFTALVRRIRDRNEWDDVFVDALHTPPVSFTLGSVIAHIPIVGVVRRQTVIDALRELGVGDVESRDPIEWEREIAARA